MQTTTNLRAHQPLRKRTVIWSLLGLLLLAVVVSTAGWGYQRFWPREIRVVALPDLPMPVWSGRELELRMPAGELLGQIGKYDDELTAYLYFEYFRSLKPIDSSKVLLTAKETPSGTSFTVCLAMANDLLTSIPYLANLEAERFISSFDVSQANSFRVQRAYAQTRLFVAAYDAPMRTKMSSLPRRELTTNVARFILFKAKTDRRVRQQIEPAPPKLSQGEARDLASDVIAVADFYDLPLDFFLGIGAMENNYLNVRGDLKHTAWKRHAQPGDIVIRRKGNRVLVMNYSIGVWQITRETLRYAHALYLQDKRDYSKLPPRLRPPRKLDFDDINSHVLTTYAGLLLRNLLDRFNGNVAEAVGAYNGGLHNPNAKYSAGVEIVADYAHRVLTQAAYINGQAIAEAKFVLTAKPHQSQGAR